MDHGTTIGSWVNGIVCQCEVYGMVWYLSEMKLTTSFLFLYVFALELSKSNGFSPRTHSLSQSAVTTKTRLELSLLDTADVAVALPMPSQMSTTLPFPAINQNSVAYTTSTLFSAEDGGGIVDILRNIAIAITAVLFLLAGLTYLTASVLIPAAAKELEQECKALAPELWEEYQKRLEPGQTIAQRPELMQELGAKLQPLLDAKIEKQFEEKKAQGIDVSEEEKAWRAIDSLNNKQNPPSSSKPSSETGPVLDLTTTQSQWDDDEEELKKK